MRTSPGTDGRRRRAGRLLAVGALSLPLSVALFAAPALAAPPADAPAHGLAKKAAVEQTAPSEAPRGLAKKAEPAPSTSPQPLSDADRNGTGANPGETCDHAYCSTRDGSPSGNGNGGGEATGKPCAGCVGKADNKNPPGQAVDGSDHNAGYECDRNSGIGRTNPAHTGCAAPVLVEEPPVQTCATNPELPGCPTGQTCATNPELPGCPTETVVLPEPPLENPEQPTSEQPTPEQPVVGTPPAPAAPAAVSPVKVLARGATAPLEVGPPAAAVPTVLPFTGAELTLLLPLALALLGSGAVLLRYGRVRRPASLR